MLTTRERQQFAAANQGSSPSDAGPRDASPVAKSVAMALEQSEHASRDAASSATRASAHSSPDGSPNPTHASNEPSIDPPDALDRTLEEAVERAFISPRVVDQAAFDSLAGTLRKLTTDAQTHARTLSISSVQIGHLQESVRGLIKDLQTRIDGALKTLPTLDTRISRTQALLDRVTTETALTKARELRDAILQEVAQHRDAIVHEAIQTALDGAKERLASDLSSMVRDALDQSRADAILSARSQAHADDLRAGTPPAFANPSVGPDAAMLASIEQRLTHAASNAIATQLDALTLRAREALHDFESGIDRLEARLAAIQADAERGVERAELAEKSLEEAAIRAQLRLRAASGDAERRTEAVATEIAEQLLALRTDAGAVVNAGREQLAAESRRLTDAMREEASQALERALQSRGPMLAETREAPPQPAIIAAAIADAERAAEAAPDFARLAAARPEIESLLQRLDASRSGIDQAIDQAVARCDHHTRASAAALEAIEGRIARLSKQPEASTPIRAVGESASLLSLQQVQLQVQQQAMQMQQLTTQAMQVGQWLAQLLQHAQQVSQAQR